MSVLWPGGFVPSMVRYEGWLHRARAVRPVGVPLPRSAILSRFAIQCFSFAVWLHKPAVRGFFSQTGRFLRSMIRSPIALV